MNKKLLEFYKWLNPSPEYIRKRDAMFAQIAKERNPDGSINIDLEGIFDDFNKETRGRTENCSPTL